MGDKTFKLEELNADFWTKVILIKIRSSSGLGGPGSLWIVTSDKKQYYISFETFLFDEINLSEFCPILKKKEVIEDYAHPFVVENNGWKYLTKENTLIRDDFYENFIEAYNLYLEHYKGQGLAIRHTPTIAGYALGVEGKLERFNEEKAYLLWQQQEREEREREEKRKRISLTSEDFVWKKLYPNNIPSDLEIGEYALLFKNVEEHIVGYKFTILYQREELTPLCAMHGSSIQGYILLEQRYNDVQGPLYLNDGMKDKEYYQAFDSSSSLNNYCVNSYGEFVRAFKTIEEAKEYAMQVANIRGYANKKNVIRDIDSEELMYKNWNRKYQGILAFRKYYKEILEIVCEFQFPSKHSDGGGYILNEIREKIDIDEDLLKEMWQYVPLILTPQTQEKAKNIVEECKINLK